MNKILKRIFTTQITLSKSNVEIRRKVLKKLNIEQVLEYVVIFEQSAKFWRSMAETFLWLSIFIMGLSIFAYKYDSKLAGWLIMPSIIWFYWKFSTKYQDVKYEEKRAKKALEKYYRDILLEEEKLQ